MGWVAALLLCTTAVQADADQDCSIGGGMGRTFVGSIGGLSGIGYSSSVNGAPLVYFGTSTLVPTASLERRVSRDTWLLLGLTAAYANSSNTPPPMAPLR